MLKLKVEGNKIGDLAEYLSSSNSNDEDVCRASIVKEIDGKKVGFFVYEGSYLRTQSSVSCSVFLCQTDPNSCEIVVVGSGGATLIGVTWGAQKDIEKKISKAILDYAVKLGMKGDYSS